MILEGVVTTTNDDGTTNVAPMGPIVDESLKSIVLRPFRTSRTYANLKERPEGVLHVTDDVLLLARAAIGRLENSPDTHPAEHVAGAVLTDACRWYEFVVEQLDDSAERTRIEARVVHGGRHRDFFGFNRAKHAVLEAAILATRLHLLPEEEVREEFRRLAVPVEKTAGPREHEAFALLSQHVDRYHARDASTGGSGITG